MRAAGVLIVCRARGQLFLCLRNNPPRAWSMVGGQVERAESFPEAAIREAVEELGGLPAGHFIDHVSYGDPQNNHFCTLVFDVPPRVIETWTPALDGEHQLCRWFPLQSLPTPLHPGVEFTLRYSSVLTP